MYTFGIVYDMCKLEKIEESKNWQCVIVSEEESGMQKIRMSVMKAKGLEPIMV